MAPLIIMAVVFVLVALLVAFMLGACKVASDADDQSDALYDSLMQAKKPADPEPARRVGLRMVKG